MIDELYKQALGRIDSCLEQADFAESLDAEQGWLYAAHSACDVALRISELPEPSDDA